jgi:hypothetical protein
MEVKSICWPSQGGGKFGDRNRPHLSEDIGDLLPRRGCQGG